VFAPVQFVIHPCLTGLPCFETLSVAFSEHYRDDFAQFSVRPSAPGTFNSVIHGAGNFIGASEPAGEIEVLDVFNREVESGFISTPDKKFSVNRSELLACPVSATPLPANAGSFYVGNECFNDGTDLDSDKVSIIFKKPGDSRSRTSNDLPGFIIEENNKTYGMNRRYEMTITPEQFVISDTLRVHIMRCLPLSNGDIFYYGVLTPCDTGDSDDVFDIRLDYQRSDNTKIASFNTYKHIDSARLETVSVFQNYPANNEPVDDFFVSDLNLLPGIYQIHSMNLKMSSVKIKRRSESNSAFRTVASHPVLNFEPVIPVNTVAADKITLEIKPYIGRLFYIRYSSSTGQYVPVVVNSNSVFLSGDSVSAIELSSGDVSIFYLRDQGEGLYPDKISLANVKLTPGSGQHGITIGNQLNSNLFEKIHCFDVVSDKYRNIHILFNYRTDETEYYPSEKQITETDYLTDPKIRNFPSLAEGFYSVTLSESDLGIRSIGQGSFATVDKPASFVPLVTVREHLRSSSYDSVQITEKVKFESDEDTLRSYRYIARAEAGFIRANYDSERNAILVSVIEQRRRIPCLVYGLFDSWREVAIPSLDGLNPDSSLFYKGTFNRGNFFGRLPPTSEIIGVYFSVYSMSSDFYVDGTIHSAVNQYYTPVTAQSGEPD
jgi:hypothetical protein